MASTDGFSPAYLAQPTPWQNQPGSIVGIAATATTISALCVLSRLYIRWKIIRSMGLDDLFVGLYLLTTITAAIGVCLTPEAGLGQHFPNLSQVKIRRFLVLFYILNGSYMSSTAFMKLSLLFQYLRIIKRSSFAWWTCVILVGLVSVWGVAFSFMAWVPCFPVYKYWSFQLPVAGRCYGFGNSTDRTTFVIHTAINMVFDLTIFAIPITFFDRKLSFKARMGMLVLMFMGCLVNVFAAWRLGLLVKESQTPLETADATWYAPDTILLAVLEVTLASVCASVPIFWPVLSQQVIRIFVTKEVKITHDDRYSIAGSDLELTEHSSKDAHYNDSYISDLVNPFRPNVEHGFEAQIQSEIAAKAKKKTLF